MIAANSPEYKHRTEQAREKFFETAATWRKLIADYEVTANDHVVLLTAEDDEINYYTLHYLPVMQAKRKIEKFLIVSPHADMEPFVQEHTRVPHTFAVWSKRVCDAIAWLAGIYPFTEQLTLNSFRYAADKDPFRLVDNVQILKKDVVARVVLSLDEVPDEEELLPQPASPARRRPIDWTRTDTYLPTYAPDEAALSLDYLTKKALCPLLDNGTITHSDKIALFGATRTAKWIARHLKGYPVIAYLDNDPDKTGQIIEGIPIYQPDAFVAKFGRDVRILICIQAY